MGVVVIFLWGGHFVQQLLLLREFPVFPAVIAVGWLSYLFVFCCRQCPLPVFFFLKPITETNVFDYVLGIGGRENE